MDSTSISTLVGRFGISLQPGQLQRVATYLELLLRWNRAINLTAIRGADEIIVRHFAESMYLTRFVKLQGNLLDVGSGAGFPGLALKIAVPELTVTLLEPVAKKRAFLKEVARQCGLDGVTVRGDRVEAFCTVVQREFESVTMRAVDLSRELLTATALCLSNCGCVYLWTTNSDGAKLAAPDLSSLFNWSPPIVVPLSRGREIWRGVRC